MRVFGLKGFVEPYAVERHTNASSFGKSGRYETVSLLSKHNGIETHLIDVHPDERDNIKMVLRKTYVNGDKFSGNMTFGIFNRKE